MSLRPLGARIVVRADKPEDRSKGGIFFPEQAKKPTGTGVVLAIGPGMLCKDGTRWPMPHLDVGDRVIFDARHPFPQVKFNDEPALILRDDTVLGVLVAE